jgi:transcriptional regulator with XRE-family HTH domain
VRYLNTRVKNIRKLLNLSQQEFGSKLGVTGAGISRIESGKRNLTEQMIILICKEFNINENWLRNGEGEIFKQFSNAGIGELLQQFQLDDLDIRIINEYIMLDDKKRKVIKEYIMRIAHSNPVPQYLSDGEIKNEVLRCAEDQAMGDRL